MNIRKCHQRGISDREEKEIRVDQAIDLSIRSTPGLRRPVGRLKSLRESLKIARPVITSWDREALVGIARTLLMSPLWQALPSTSSIRKKESEGSFSEEHDFVWSLRARLY
ncbi:hypothetical protein [Leptospirillum ferriphilum]|uniref:hypothetical protein n=1 Tax=Leptospirillum ferriphilum TaxID=178606 RepID=UPI001179BA38|nr:hypothetical protein [Leptospirillum ferriphilum]